MVEQGSFKPEVARSSRAAPTTKICSKCKKRKAVKHFGVKNRKTGKRQSYCFPCQRINSKNWYQENKQKHKATVRKNNDRYRKKLHQVIIDYLLIHPCASCGEDDIVVLQFHHRRRSRKIMEISKMITALRSVDELKAEIKKCDVLCANCHTRKEAKKNGSFRLIMEGSD